jgi:uroporphyrinogen-III decarboxylase
VTGFERIYTAMSGGKADCVPFMPKIWVKLAGEITGTSLQDIISNPYMAMKAIFDAGKSCGVDGVRVFKFPKRITRYDESGNLIEYIDGKPVGKIDIKGGLATHQYEDNTIDIGDEYTVAFIQFWKQESPLVKSMDDVRRIAVPTKSFYDELGFGKYIETILSNAEELAVVGNCGSPTLSFYSYFRNGSLALMDFYDDPGMVRAVMEKGVQIAIEKGKFCVDNGLKILRLNDSTANMNVISPVIFKEFIKPYFKAVCDELHNYSRDVRIYCHNCGNILPVMNDLVETGLDCIAPLDPLGGFSCADARAVIPAGYPLMGGIDTLSFINSTPSQIESEALDCIKGAGRSGSFILGSGCVLPPGSDSLLIKTAAETAHTYKY